MGWILMEAEEGENGHLRPRAQHGQRKGEVNNMDVWRVTGSSVCPELGFLT